MKTKRESHRQDRTAPPERQSAALGAKIRAYQTVGIALIAVTIVLTASAIWSHTLLWGTQNKMTRLEATLQAAERKMAALTQKVDALEGMVAALPGLARAELAAQSQLFEDQIINSGSALLKSTIALAKKDMAAYGLSGHRFNMVEFDRRACPQGGVFSGELPDGARQDQPFDPNIMVDILESHTDIRGIPFYHARIGGIMVGESGEPAAFRHGSMRIECR